MSTNSDMNGWIRRAMTPKHALEAFVGLLAGQNTDQGSREATETDTPPGGGPPPPPRRRVDLDAGEGRGPEAEPEVGGTANGAMNRLLRAAVRNKDRI